MYYGTTAVSTSGKPYDDIWLSTSLLRSLTTSTISTFCISCHCRVH